MLDSGSIHKLRDYYLDAFPTCELILSGIYKLGQKTLVRPFTGSGSLVAERSLITYVFYECSPTAKTLSDCSRV